MKSTLDVHLPDKAQDEEYLQILADCMERRVLSVFQPDLILYQVSVVSLLCQNFGLLTFTIILTLCPPSLTINVTVTDCHSHCNRLRTTVSVAV